MPSWHDNLINKEYIFMALYLVKHRDKFTCYVYNEMEMYGRIIPSIFNISNK